MEIDHFCNEVGCQCINRLCVLAIYLWIHGYKPELGWRLIGGTPSFNAVLFACSDCSLDLSLSSLFEPAFLEIRVG